MPPQENNILIRLNSETPHNKRTLETIEAWLDVPTATATRQILYDATSIYDDELSRIPLSYRQAEVLLRALRPHAHNPHIDPDILEAYIPQEVRRVLGPLTRVQALAILDGTRRYWRLSEPLENIFTQAVNPAAPKRKQA